MQQPAVYTATQLGNVMRFITQAFGTPEGIFEERTSPGVKIDIAVVAPTTDRPFYTLCTIGLGAFCMALPPERQEEDFAHTELVLTLPPNWDIYNLEEECWYWPIRMLKTVARIPYSTGGYLAFGQAVNSPLPPAAGVGFVGAVLLSPYTGWTEDTLLVGGEEVTCLQLLPLYQEEIIYCRKYGPDSLLRLFGNQVSHITQPQRPNFALA